jgi:hypothetical protein
MRQQCEVFICSASDRAWLPTAREQKNFSAMKGLSRTPGGPLGVRRKLGGADLFAPLFIFTALMRCVIITEL